MTPRSVALRSLRAALPLWLVLATYCASEELWLFDNTRVHGIVQSVAGGRVAVRLYDGQIRQVPLEQIIAIRFLGRNPLFIQSGSQEFRFLHGGKLRGQIAQNEGDVLHVETALAGPVDLELHQLKGFAALPMAGFVGRKAEELVESGRGDWSVNLDMVLDRRGAAFPCVVSAFERTQMFLDYEESPINKPIQIYYLSGVRLADAGRHAPKTDEESLQVQISARDGSVVVGLLERIHMGVWYLKPAWESAKPLGIRLEEISQVKVLGGRVQYLSTMTPREVDERTTLTPPQAHQMDRDCQGYDLSIAGKRYPWGIGVHANSKLSFNLGGRFKEFHCEAGIATRMGARGSVIFAVFGDGKELFKSSVVRGGEPKPTTISVPIEGVNVLTLQVTHAGDLDLGDAANWGSARVTR